MNILLAFKAEPDAGMLAEKEWQAAAQGKSGPDISLLRSLLGADEQAAAALLLAQRKNGTPMSLTALSMGMNGHCTGCAISWLLGLRKLYCWRRRQNLRFAPEFVARHIAEWQHQNPLESDNYRLPKQRRAEWANAIFAGGNAGLALLHPGGAFHSRRAVYHPRTAY